MAIGAISDAVPQDDPAGTRLPVTVHYRLSLHNGGAHPVEVESVDVPAQQSMRVESPVIIRAPHVGVGERTDIVLTLAVDCTRPPAHSPAVRIVAHSVGGPRQTVEQTPVEAGDPKGSPWQSVCGLIADESASVSLTAAEHPRRNVAVLTVDVESRVATRLTKLEVIAPGIASRVRGGLPRAIRAGRPATVTLDVRVTDCPRAVAMTETASLKWRMAATADSAEDNGVSDDGLTRALFSLILRACR